MGWCGGACFVDAHSSISVLALAAAVNHAPTFTSPTYTLGPVTSFAQAIGPITAADIDLPTSPDGQLTYSLVSSGSSSNFLIDVNTGTIISLVYVAGSQSFTFTLVATDGGGLSTSASITITTNVAVTTTTSPVTSTTTTISVPPALYPAGASASTSWTSDSGAVAFLAIVIILVVIIVVSLLIVNRHRKSVNIQIDNYTLKTKSLDEDAEELEFFNEEDYDNLPAPTRPSLIDVNAFNDWVKDRQRNHKLERLAFNSVIERIEAAAAARKANPQGAPAPAAAAARGPAPKTPAQSSAPKPAQVC